MTEALYQPSVWQQEFHALRVHEALGAGSAGVGKSLCLTMDPMEQVIVEHQRCADRAHPFHQRWGHSTGWALHLRRELGELEQTIARSQILYPGVDPKAHWNSTKNLWTFSSGFKVQFGHCNGAEDHAKYLSNAYCLAEGQRIVMADGSLRAIEDVAAGELVLTLEGPKRVLATWDSGVQHCSALDVRHPTTGGLLGTQLQPTTHPVLVTSSDVPPLSESPGTRRSEGPAPSHAWYWQDYESLLDGARVSRAKRVSTIDAESCFVGSDGARRAVSQLPALTVRLVLHEQSVRRAALRRATGCDADRECSQSCCGSCLPGGPRPESSGSCSGRKLAGVRRGPGRSPDTTACDAAGAPAATGTAIGSTGRCSTGRCPRDARPPAGTGSGPRQPRRPGGAGARSRAGLRLGALGNAPSRSRATSETSYPHFYSEEDRPLTEGVCIATGLMRYAGLRRTFDLTVEDANHYIGEFGMVSSQTHIAFDELTTFSKAQYDGVTSRLRSADPVLRQLLKVRSMSNPGVSPGADPHWVRKMFVDPHPEGRKLLARTIKRTDGTTFTRTRIYLPGRLTDNPNKQFAADYEETLSALPVHIRKAYRDGDWYFRPGSFFGEDWDKTLHVVKPFKIPSDWPVFRAMDWGFKSPGNVGWYAFDPDGDLYKICELKFQGQTDEQVAEQIKHEEERLGLWDKVGKCSRITGPADTQLWEERGDSGKRKVDVFRDKGIMWVQADKKSRVANAGRLIKRLRDHNNGTQNPGLMVFSTCKYTITTLPQVDTDPDDPEQPLKGGDDHAVDETMYAAAYASHGPSRVHVRREKEDRDDDDDDDASDREALRGQGRYGYGSPHL